MAQRPTFVFDSRMLLRSLSDLQPCSTTPGGPSSSPSLPKLAFSATRGRLACRSSEPLLRKASSLARSVRSAVVTPLSRAS